MLKNKRWLPINHFGPLHSLSCFHCHVVLGSRKWPHHLFWVCCSVVRIGQALSLSCVVWTNRGGRIPQTDFSAVLFLCVAPWCLFERLGCLMWTIGHLSGFRLFALREEKFQDSVFAVLGKSLSALHRRIGSPMKKPQRRYLWVIFARALSLKMYNLRKAISQNEQFKKSKITKWTT